MALYGSEVKLGARQGEAAGAGAAGDEEILMGQGGVETRPQGGKVRRRSGLALEEHQELGRELKAMRDRLVTLDVRLENTYGKNVKATRWATRAWNALDELRSELDNLVFQEYPDLDTHGLVRVYYPGPRPPE